MDATAKLRTALAGTALIVGVGGVAALPSALLAQSVWSVAFVAASFAACGLLFAAAASPTRRRMLGAGGMLLAMGAAAIAFYATAQPPIVILAVGLSAAGAAVGALLVAMRMPRPRRSR